MVDVGFGRFYIQGRDSKLLERSTIEGDRPVGESAEDD